MSNELITWLEEEIKQRGWSQSELAKRARLNRAVISKILNGYAKPTPETLQAIARALNVPQYEVFYRAGLITQLPPDLQKLPKEARQLIDLFLELPPDEQEDFLAYLERRVQRQQIKQQQGQTNALRPAKP